MTIWLIGAGGMAVDYAKVLDGLNLNYTVIGRSEASAATFKAATGKNVETGGLQKWLEKSPALPTHCIVATPVEALAVNTIALLDYGIKEILLEKPGGLNSEELNQVAKKVTEKKADVFIAYNRRFYASTRKALQMIEEDGGVSSFHFEFTEWAHTIEPLQKPKEVFETWFLANSSHVVDLAFFLGGTPEILNTIKSGHLKWHSASSKFAGCGITEEGATFSYCANWDAPGRWSLEIMTPLRRLIFRPMEQLQVWRKGSVSIEPVEIEDNVDKSYKPGLLLQTVAFLEKNTTHLIDIKTQLTTCDKFYNSIAGY